MCVCVCMYLIYLSAVLQFFLFLSFCVPVMSVSLLPTGQHSPNVAVEEVILLNYIHELPCLILTLEVSCPD